MPRDSQVRPPVAAHRLAPRGWLRIFTFLAVLVTFGGLAYGAHLVPRSRGRQLVGEASLDRLRRRLPVALRVDNSLAEPDGLRQPEPDDVRELQLRRPGDDLQRLGRTRRSAPRSPRSSRGSSEFTLIDSQAWSGALPPANVVRFQDPALGDTAALVAELLGVQTVASGPTEGPAIAVILVTDPRPQPKVTPSPGASPSPTP